MFVSVRYHSNLLNTRSTKTIKTTRMECNQNCCNCYCKKDDYTRSGFNLFVFDQLCEFVQRVFVKNLVCLHLNVTDDSSQKSNMTCNRS